MNYRYLFHRRFSIALFRCSAFLLVFIFYCVSTNSQQSFKTIEADFLKSIPANTIPEDELGSVYKKYVRWKYFVEPRLNPDGSYPDPDIIKQSISYYKATKLSISDTVISGNWKFAGPKYYSTGDLSSYAPGIGRVDVISFHPDNDEIIFAGTPTGGLWKSTDAGST
jgi:hypothetical protein